jgi:glycosyltransferase involved in cell wall biosynthesis
MTPRISVITCCWNSEPFIEQCIASVRAQRGVDIEHVFVDGGSTDGTLERIQTLAAAAGGSVRWVTDVRGGISNAMNVGAGLATGDWIAHLHGDDYYLGTDAVAKAVAAMQAQRARWAYGRIASDLDGKLVSDTWAMPAWSPARLLRGNFIGHPSVFIERTLFEASGGFDTGLKYAMDYDLWLRMARIAAPVYLGYEVAAFRRHAGSLSTAQADKAFEEDHAVRRRHIGANPLSRLFHELVYRRRLKRRAAVGA